MLFEALVAALFAITIIGEHLPSRLARHGADRRLPGDSGEAESYLKND